jgi:hypothetical protein
MLQPNMFVTSVEQPYMFVTSLIYMIYIQIYITYNI